MEPWSYDQYAISLAREYPYLPVGSTGFTDACVRRLLAAGITDSFELLTSWSSLSLKRAPGIGPVTLKEIGLWVKRCKRPEDCGSAVLLSADGSVSCRRKDDPTGSS